MHTVETDGRNTIEEMAEAARAHGYKYMAITDHSKNLAFANGLDDQRAVGHIKRIRAANEKMDGIRIFAGIEVDILADGTLDLSDSVLEQMDLVIASVHSHFNQSPSEMTESPAQSRGKSQHFIPGASDWTHASPPRCLSVRRRRGPQGRRPAQGRDGAKCLSR
jgi:histidinol phosphatase-like PHP family hydrolase